MPVPQRGRPPHTEHVLREELRLLVCRIKNSDPTALGDTDDYASALEYDSLDFVELAVRLDTEYGIEVGAEADDLPALASLDTLTALVRDRRTR
ncbi:acyl carrier protein [Streptosporangium sp. NPDC020072]|uniref:Acyl carrier protein n=1 Tax=Streptosporangium jomthongense TaxID=1193683 RepID=A0ABV8FB02_9ACTN